MPFNRPPITGRELSFLQEAVERRQLSGDGHFSKQCQRWLVERLGANGPAHPLLHGRAGDGGDAGGHRARRRSHHAVVHVRLDGQRVRAARRRAGVRRHPRPTRSISTRRTIEAAITPRTQGDRAGALRRRRLRDGRDHATIAARHGCCVDRGRGAGPRSPLSRPPARRDRRTSAPVSFHETKNVICGEGGALLINDPRFVERAEIIREKGTNRSAFFRGQVDKYTWVDIGSSYLPSELVAAFLHAQLEDAEMITAERRATWDIYHAAFADLEARDIGVRRPIVPAHCEHNGHLYYLLLPDRRSRDALIEGLRERRITAFFHYVPLHSSAAGQRFGRAVGRLAHTNDVSERLVRLPLWSGMQRERERVVDCVYELAGRRR